MLEILNEDHIKTLKEFHSKLENQEYLKYYNVYNYFSLPDLSKDLGDDWHCIQRVSLDNDNNIIGYFSASTSRAYKKINNLCFLNITKKPNITLAKDLLSFIDSLFMIQGFSKITFSAVTEGKPNKKYNKLIHRLNGRIVGEYLEDVQLYDQSICGMTLYELLKNDYIKSDICKTLRNTK